MADEATETENIAPVEAQNEQTSRETVNTDEPKPVEPEEKTFTQADLDRILAGRLSKYSDYDDMKSKLAEFEEQAMTEKEREVAKARREAIAEANTAANTRIIRSEARALAAEMDFESPTLAIRLADLSAVTVDDEGEVDGKSLKAALQAVADEAPGLLKTRKGALGAQGQSSGANGVPESNEEYARRVLGL